jgi:hypothetical protein
MSLRGHENHSPWLDDMLFTIIEQLFVFLLNPEVFSEPGQVQVSECTGMLRFKRNNLDSHASGQLLPKVMFYTAFGPASLRIF